ncbi:DNA annealing helicase and endonuclease ZRANB3-like [Babylonia areolata]|uniref:DNA annealing helicase and endonuclease ZRANB3-like n=1 Tax=Babylonia areolata TaxID=304850 RepID=UPI003FCF7079
MPFQREGVLFAVRKGGRCLIADEMGLGKTLQAIAVASYFQSEWPLLIVVPSSLRYAWIEELEKWLPDILPHDINLIQGGFDTSGIVDAKITIVTYGLLSCKSSGPVKEALKARQFQIAICDESHYFKNSRTECCKTVSPLLTSATRCILLSGTPALAKPSELFTQLDALLPGKFGSFWSFTKKYCAARWEFFGRRRQWRADGASNLDELQSRLTSVMIRREKNSVLNQLPPKQRQKILFALKDSQTKKEILSTFEELKPLLKRSKSSLAANLLGGDQNSASMGPEGVNSGQQTDTNILSRIQRLYNLTGEAKVGPAREYIQMLCENASLKFLVFAYHHTMMDGLQQTLWDRKIKFVRIDGQTKASDRQLYVQQFQSDKETRVAILSILAAGVGLTLTAASLVVFAELYWTPGVMVQCEDRAHRIGQTSTVPVHYLVARETMDEWVWSAVCRKTIVTSTTLTGKRQALQADAGDRYQVELLSSADAYTPEDNSDIDISQLIQSQRPRDQKSILDFFGSQRDPSQGTPSSMKPVTNPSPSRAKDVDPEDTDGGPATPSAQQRDRQRSFPIFTSLKKPSLSKSLTEVFQSKVSQDPVIINSSDDESKGTCHNSSRVDNENWAEKNRNDPKTRNRNQRKSGISRKRRCVESDPENLSDSEFKETPSKLSHSLKKKKKLDSKSARSLPKRTSSPWKSREGESETGSRQDRGLEGGEHWSCLSCTFSNSSLLPFCEVCETPRKSKAQTSANETVIPAKLSVTAKSPSSVSLEDFELSSPVCSSTQVSKLRVVEKCIQRTGREELCEGDDDMVISNQMSRSRAKRNLTFGVDTSHSSTESVTDKAGKQRSHEGDIHLHSSSQENSHGTCSPELVNRSRNEEDEESCKLSEDSELVSFQLNSSMEKEDGYTSPCLLESDEGEDQDTLAASNDHTEHNSSLSSPQSAGSTRNDLSVTEPVCSGSESWKENESADSAAADKTLMSSSFSNGMTNKFVRNNADKRKDLPEIKSQKRKCFMLATPEKPCKEESRVKHDFPVDSTVNRTGDTSCVEDFTDHPTDLTTEEKQTGSTAEKSKAAPKKPDCCEKRPALCGEVIEEAPAEQEGRPEGGETAPSKAKACTAGAGEGSIVPGEERGDAVSDSVDSISQCDQQDSGDGGHSAFMFCCSSYTGRVYLFDMNGESLKASFLPLDVELGNVGELPDILHHPHHLRLAQHFVRQWNSLTDTKRRLIVKRGLKFHNPLAAYDSVRTDLANNKQRYQTKGDQAKAALRRAKEVQGSVRVLSKHARPARLSLPDHKEPESSGDGAAKDTTLTWPQGYVQVMSAEGTPLCVHCQQPCTSLVSSEAVVDGDMAWNTRFCSRVCADAHWMKTNTAYLRSSVYDVQHGVCQLCGFDAHTFFCQIRDSVDRLQRAELINSSKFSKLGNGQKKQMVARPYEGLFWHVDHIRPVWEGGGQCDIDNLRTLCTPCHLSVTARQAAQRATARKLSRAACSRDITAFFFKKS